MNNLKELWRKLSDGQEQLTEILPALRGMLTLPEIAALEALDEALDILRPIVFETSQVMALAAENKKFLDKLSD